MIKNNRVIAVIPARAGSKAVKDKNIHPLGGKPLIAWPIEVARNCPEIDRIIVSTDGAEIAAVASQWGAEVYERPAKLASDESVVIDTLRDLIAQLRDEGEKAVYMLLLEATSPFRTASDIQTCLKLLVANDLDSVATFTEASLPPEKAWRIEGGVPVSYLDGADPWLPRQKTGKAWELNGAIYAFAVERLPDEGKTLLFGQTGAVLMPKERSIDINEKIDFLIAEAMFEMKNADPTT
jgi:CMP-N,N'-diacetyllegionaminic acid synthase